MGMDHAREFGDDLDPKGGSVLRNGIQDFAIWFSSAQNKQLLIRPGQVSFAVRPAAARSTVRTIAAPISGTYRPFLQSGKL